DAGKKATEVDASQVSDNGGQDNQVTRSIDYDEVFAPVARIEAIRLFLAYASFKDYVVYQMYVKSAFPYEKIEEENSPFDLEVYSDSDYAGASLDMKSTTRGCQFLGKRLISWQCKKQTIVANSTTEAAYVAAARCCGQVLWIQNQMLNYGFNLINTKIYIDNENETIYKEWEDKMARAATTASSLEEEQDNGNINRTQSMATLNEPLPLGTSLGSGLRNVTPLFETMMVNAQEEVGRPMRLKEGARWACGHRHMGGQGE
nr:putative ribonuclease H-like domain-containing protein [Tanacetum cinerariifolium]